MAEQASNRKRILLCVDGSEYCEKAFNFYRDVMHQPNHLLIILHASSPVKLPSVQAIGAYGVTTGIALNKAEIEEAVKKLKAENDALKDSYVKKCQEAKIDNEVVIVPGEGGVDHAIIDYMRENELSAVVLGTKGRGNIKRKLMGSVSHHVMHHSHVPIVLCPHENDHYHHHHGKK